MDNQEIIYHMVNQERILRTVTFHLRGNNLLTWITKKSFYHMINQEIILSHG